jgi:Cytochrome C biogenesis protein transmembrane region
MIFIEGLTLGLANNFFCVGTCAPALLPIVLGQKDKPVYPVIKFMTGRLLAYIIFATVSGAAGIYFEGRINPRIFSFFVLLLAIFMITFALADVKLKLCPAGLASLVGSNIPFYTGFVMGLNICPPFLIGLSKTLELGSILWSVIFFLGFYLGSSAWLILFLFSGKLPKSYFVNITGRILAATVGLWYFYKGIIMLFF